MGHLEHYFCIKLHEYEINLHFDPKEISLSYETYSYTASLSNILSTICVALNIYYGMVLWIPIPSLSTLALVQA